jgi:gamma-glutamylaminecyclotransferase
MHSTTTTLFVYGTLLKGEANHGLLAKSQFVGQAKTNPEYTLVDLGAYPAMVEGGQTAILGEVYRIEEQTLLRLDRLEGHPHYYTRKTIELEGGMNAEAYVLDQSRYRGSTLIAGGDWRTRDRQPS